MHSFHATLDDEHHRRVVRLKKSVSKCPEAESLSLSLPLSLALIEQIRGRRPRREALQLPAHAPQPRRQETALYWGKTRLLLPRPRHPAAHLGPRPHAAWAGPSRGGGGAAEGFNNRTIALRQHSCRNLNSRQPRLSLEQPPSEPGAPRLGG